MMLMVDQSAESIVLALQRVNIGRPCCDHGKRWDCETNELFATAVVY